VSEYFEWAIAIHSIVGQGPLLPARIPHIFLIKVFFHQQRRFSMSLTLMVLVQ